MIQPQGKAVANKILVIEDEKHIAEIIANRLTNAGYACDIAYDGASAISMLSVSSYDLVTIDIMIPETDGLEVCKHIHKKHPKTMIVIISSLDTDEKKSIAYGSGSDDFIAKPFNGKELVMKIDALFRRREISESGNISILNGALRINDEKKKVTLNGTEVLFTPSEYLLFSTLANNKKLTFSRDKLSELLWDNGFDLMDDRVIDSHIYHIRKKLSAIDENLKDAIKTVRGFGYRLNEF